MNSVTFLTENGATIVEMPGNMGGGWLIDFPTPAAYVFVPIEGETRLMFKIRCAPVETGRQYLVLGVEGHAGGEDSKEWVLCDRTYLVAKSFAICRSFRQEGGRFTVSMPGGGSVRIFEALMKEVEHFDEWRLGEEGTPELSF